MQAIAQEWTTGICSLSVAQTPEVIKLRQQGEEQQALERARECVERAVKDLKNKIASENEEVRHIYKQITPTFDRECCGLVRSLFPLVSSALRARLLCRCVSS